MPVKRLEFMEVTPADRQAFNPFTEASAGGEAPGPFRIGELSRLSGVPIGTIKYYLREGLLPPGQATAKTQALYDVAHLRRLRVVGVLADVGKLSIAQIREIATQIDGGDASGRAELAQVVGYALTSARRTTATTTPEPDVEEQSEQDVALRSARAATDAFVDTLGFQVDPAAPARADLAEALLALRELGVADDPIVFYDHARLAYELAEIEISVSAPIKDPAASVEAITVGSVIFGAAFLALRRMGHEHEVRRLEDVPLVPVEAPGDDPAVI